MKTAIVTDGKYRMSIAAVRALSRAGYHVVVTQTREDVQTAPPVSVSKHCAEFRWIDGHVTDTEYKKRLISVLQDYERPILFCVGAVTLNLVAAQREEFSSIADFLVASQSVLDQLNDKEIVHERAEKLGIPVPKQYKDNQPDDFPVVIKPHCGEKFGLKAADRYAVAHNTEEYHAIMTKMRQYDSQPLVQQKIEGAGAGVSLLLDKEGNLICALCHRRIREYPITGGPSTCCESFYDETMIRQAYQLFHSFGFVGFGMVEFKDHCVLEVNPRIWGSFPMTEATESPFVAQYARAASGEAVPYTPKDYKIGVRMRFFLNDTVAILHYLKSGQVGTALRGIGDCFTAKEALHGKGDNRVFRTYLKQSLFQR
ncbi:ATP-grasp domain-containing protein [Butyricicoccus sp.]|uniref:carboxylate--amine ligase n=1 Tax=Butyricicoccus sp. TaxID=2049021 RepID=UPI003D7ECE28